MSTTLKQISLEIPISDMSLIETIAQRMGWRFNDDNACVEQTDTARSQYSKRIEHLRSLRGTGITKQEIDSDPRLKYLLSK
jgi:hypothetical protein